MGKGSLAKIAAALAIISVYVYLFGIMGKIESLETNLPDDSAEAENTDVTADEAPENTEAPVSDTTTAAVTERVIYTYSTELNVVNGKKPSLADYTATEPLLVVAEDVAGATKATTTTPQEDLSFAEEDFDFTTTKATTTAPVTTTTTAATTSLTTAATQIITVAQTTTTTTTTPQTATAPPETTTTTTTTTTVAETTTTTTTTTEATTTTPEASTTTAEVTTTTPETEPETSGTDPLSWMDRVTEETTTTEAVTTAPETSVAGEKLTVNAGGTVVTDDAATIVAKAVMAEVGDSFSEEAIKAQAIATYTYIKYYNQNNQNAYVVFKTPSSKVVNCVNEVIGKAIYYDGKLIQSVYSASSAGYTAASVNVWGVDYPYLRSVKTDFDAIYDINYGKQATFTSEEIKNLIQDNTGIALTGSPDTWLEITSRVDGAYVGSMKIGGQETYNNGSRDVSINGRVFREIIMEYGIRSASFDILYNAGDDTFTFTTYGYGHGVGMSQHGANILATQHGFSYDEILSFYYQGTTIA